MDFQQQLGRGFFGEVWRTVERSGQGRVFAVKKVPLQLIRQHNLLDQMDREIEILRSLRHPHIVRLYFDFRTATHIFLGLEFASGRGLFDALNRAQKFAPPLSARYFFEICEALEYLHGLPQKVIHRDIKPENILLDGEGRTKLADFGWANMLDNNADLKSTFCGTLDYLAPEMIQGAGHDELLDMWNMGVLLYEMLTGKSPFGSSSQEETCRLILALDLRFPRDMDVDAVDLIRRLCKLAPRERLPAHEAKRHRFVQTHFAAATSAAAPPSEDAHDGRPSVEARGLRQDKELLEGEMLQVLKAKGATEQMLFQISTELEEAHDEFQKEQRARIVVETSQTDLEAEIATLDKEIEALRRKVTSRRG